MPSIFMPLESDLALDLLTTKRRQKWSCARPRHKPEEGLAASTFALERVLCCHTDVWLPCWGGHVGRRGPAEPRQPKDQGESEMAAV